MHDVPTRQLIALAATLIAMPLGPAGAADELRMSSPVEQVQAAKLMQARLAATGAKPEEWRKLEETYASLAALHPRDVNVRIARGEFYRDTGSWPRAVSDWERAAQIDPTNSRVLEHLGDAASALGEPRKAVAYYQQAVASNPNEASGHFALANACFLFRHDLREAGMIDEVRWLNEALGHFAKAAQLAPQNLDYARAYAETYYSLPQPDWPAALEAWKQVKLLSPKADFALGHLARIHLRMSHFDSSRNCLKLMHCPAYEQLKSRLLKQIDSLESAAEKSLEEETLRRLENPR